MLPEGIKEATVTDDLLKSIICDLLASNPETKLLGTPKLRTLLRARHTKWRIAEKRLRGIKQELLSEEALNEKQVNGGSSTPPEFKGFNKHKIYDAENGRMATVFTAPGDPAPQHMVEEDGKEYQVLLQYGMKIETFKKDEATGQWAL